MTNNGAGWLAMSGDRKMDLFRRQAPSVGVKLKPIPRSRWFELGCEIFGLERSENSTYSGDCQSWYKTADGRNTNTWVGSQREYAKRTANVRFSDFERIA